jgi:2-dehydropantoate 2-reductase
MKMKICVLGSGALGSTIGGVLAEAGSEVYLIDQWADHINEINRRGLLLREGSTDRTVKVEARRDFTGIGPADLIIVLVKSFHTRQAIEGAGAIIGDNTLVMSIQNGLGNDETLAEVVGKERLIGAKTYVGGVLLGPGHVIAGTKNKYTYIGEFDGTTTERITKVADEFNRAGLLTTISSNIVGMTWDKLLINVATGALSGITKLTYGGLYKVKEIEECAVAAVAETITVAEASGVTLSIKDPKEAWFKASEGLPDEFKTSILQSLEKGQKTEIDFINGAVVRWGEKYNVPTPVNKTIVALVKGIEYGMQDYPGKS